MATASLHVPPPFFPPNRLPSSCPVASAPASIRFSYRLPTRIRARSAAAAAATDGGGAEQFLDNNSISDFMRFKKDGGTGELQTAVVSYRKKFPWSLLQPFLQVDLVSTIHIGDKEYFETLQSGLESYDCVLYEMVASRESLENKNNSSSSKRLKASRSKGFNILGFIQRQMARVLALDFQLDCLDYEGEKWLHADLDFETFQILQTERGESFFTFARDMTLRSTKALVQPITRRDDLDPWRNKLLWASRVLPMPLVGLLIIGSVCAPTENQSTEFPELEALSRLDIGSALKIFLAKRLTSEFTEITTAVEETSVIIGERNRVATEALQTAIDSGYKRIAVLYGGGHMPDLGRRLREEFNMVPSQVQWVTAWSIKNRDFDDRTSPLMKKLAELSGWPLNRYQTLALVIFSSVLALDLWFWELFVGTAVNWATGAASGLDLLTYGIIQDGQKGKKESVLVEEGLITESLPNGMFRVRLDNQDVILGYISGKIRKNYVRILPGDRVKIEVSRYDSSKGRIIYRLGKKN